MPRWLALVAGILVVIFFATRAAARIPPDDDSRDPEKFSFSNPGASEMEKLYGCIEGTKRALESRESAAARLRLATCERQAGKLLAAARDVALARTRAEAEHDADVINGVRAEIEEIRRRLAHVTIEPPQRDFSDVVVTLDDLTVPKELFGRSLSIDPGDHFIHAEAVLRGARVAYDEHFTLTEGAAVVLRLGFKPSALTIGMPCMLMAKTQEEVLQCLVVPRIEARVASEMSGYADTGGVAVFTPGVRGAVEWPSGYALYGSYGVDIISAASPSPSPDAVSAASRYVEPRHLGRFGTRVTSSRLSWGFCGLDGKGHVGRELDAFSRGGGVVASCVLADKSFVPHLGFHYTSDTFGLRGTPFDRFHRHVATTFLEGGALTVLNARMMLLINASVELDRGDASNPYRQIAIFNPTNAARIEPGDSLETVNQLRLQSATLPEALPDERNRYALSFQITRRLGEGRGGNGGGSSTLRMGGRLYGDTWNQYAYTNDGRFLYDLSKNFTVGPHVRLHAQTSTSFWRLAYVAQTDPATGGLAPSSIPQYRSSSWALGSLATLTLGMLARFQLTPRPSSIEPLQTGYALVFQADAMGTRYFEALFLTERVAVYVTTAFEAEF